MTVNHTLNILWGLALVHITVTWISAIRRGRRARQRSVSQPQPRTEELPPVSIIIPAWNERGRIEKCIGALQQIQYLSWEAIILAGGDDGTYAVACKAVDGDIRFIILERGSEPKNVVLNRGIEAAQHDILVLLDADSIVEQDWLDMLVAPLSSGASASYGFYLPHRWTWISIEEYMIQVQYHNLEMSVFPGCAVDYRSIFVGGLGPLCQVGRRKQAYRPSLTSETTFRPPNHFP